MCRYIKLAAVAALLMLPGLANAADNATRLTLDRAIEIALAQNPGFQASGLGIKEAEHRKKAAAADFLPKLKTT